MCIEITLGVKWNTVKQRLFGVPWMLETFFSLGLLVYYFWMFVNEIGKVGEGRSLALKSGVEGICWVPSWYNENCGLNSWRFITKGWVCLCGCVVALQFTFDGAMPSIEHHAPLHSMPTVKSTLKSYFSGPSKKGKFKNNLHFDIINSLKDCLGVLCCCGCCFCLPPPLFL